MSDQHEKGQAEAAEQEQAGETEERAENPYIVKEIDDHTRMVANTFRLLADRIEEGRVHAVACGVWGLELESDVVDPNDSPHSQNVMWENIDDNIAGAFVPLLGSLCLLRTRMEHALMNAQAREEMPSPQQLMALLQADESMPQ